MPMTLECTHCHQTMAIAPRKPGSRLACPACGQSVVVPAPDQAAPVTPAPAPGASAGNAENKVPVHGKSEGAGTGTTTTTVAKPRKPANLNPAVTRPIPAGPARQQVNRAATPELDVPWLPQSNVDQLNNPDYRIAVAAPGAVVLPYSVMILLLTFALIALGLAFFAGYLWAKSSTVTPSRQTPNAISALPANVGTGGVPIHEITYQNPTV